MKNEIKTLNDAEIREVFIDFCESSDKNRFVLVEDYDYKLRNEFYKTFSSKLSVDFIYIKMKELIQEYLKSPYSDSKYNVCSVFETASVLIIDEIHNLSGKEVTQNILLDLLIKRYNSNLKTLVRVTDRLVYLYHDNNKDKIQELFDKWDIFKV